jgi:hypothetical protein
VITPALVALAALALLASWEGFRQLRSTQRAYRRARRAVERAEDRLAATRAALNTATVERDGRESDYYAARGEAARLRRELHATRERTARVVELWPEALARAEVAYGVARSGRAVLVPVPGAGPLPTWYVRDGRLCVRWGVA